MVFRGNSALGVTDPVMDWVGNDDGTEAEYAGGGETLRVGWLLHVDVPLPASAFERACAFVERVTAQRVLGLVVGPTREAGERRLALLRARRVVQAPREQDGEGLAYQSTERTRPDRTFFDLGSL